MNEVRELTTREFLVASGVLSGKMPQAAAIEAGYSAKTANVQAYRLLAKPHVKQFIKAEKEKLAKRREISLDKIQEEMASIAYAKITDYISLTGDGSPYFDLTKMDSFQAGAISAIDIEEYVDGRGEDARDVKKVKLKLHDKQAALMNLAKLCGFIGKDSALIDVTPNDPDAQDMRELARRMVFMLQQGQRAAHNSATGAASPLRQIEGAATQIDGSNDGTAEPSETK
jgi:phage terminase small subunit